MIRYGEQRARLNQGLGASGLRGPEPKSRSNLIYHHHQGEYYMSLLKSQARILSSLMMVIKPKHVGAVLM